MKKTILALLVVVTTCHAMRYPAVHHPEERYVLLEKCARIHYQPGYQPFSGTTWAAIPRRGTPSWATAPKGATVHVLHLVDHPETARQMMTAPVAIAMAPATTTSASNPAPRTTNVGGEVVEVPATPTTGGALCATTMTTAPATQWGTHARTTYVSPLAT